MILHKKRKTILWAIDGSLKKQLHMNARIKPAVELHKAGWKVLMMTSAAPDNSRELPVTFIEFSWPEIYFFGAVIYYFKLLKFILSGKSKADILFFQMDSFAVILLLVPLWQQITNRWKYTVVMDYRSLPMNTRSARGKLRGIVFLLGETLSRYLEIKITAITKQLAEALNIPKKQLVGFWPSGADLDVFSNCYEGRQWPEKDGPIRLIYLGVITEERNLKSVIHAARLAWDNGIKLTLNVIGDGSQKEELKNIAEPYGGFIHVGGPVPYHMVPDLLAKNDIGILPFPDVPKMNVSSAIKMFEYMAAGMPILATRIPAHTNVFGDEEFVFWCTESAESMAEAMMLIDRSKTKLSLLGAKAKNRSREYSWEKSAAKLSEAINRAVIC